MRAGNLNRLDARHYLGFRRINTNLNSFTADRSDIIYEVAPVGIGKIINMRLKVEPIAGKCFYRDLLGKGMFVNPLHLFAYKRFALYMSFTLNHDRKKVEKNMKNELCSDLMNPQKSEMEKIVQSIVKEIYQTPLMKRIEQLQKREDKLVQFQKIVDEWGETAVNKSFDFIRQTQHLIGLQKEQKKLVTYPRYIEEKVAEIRKIQPLTKDQQNEKYKMFAERHRQYFNSKIEEDKKTHQSVFKISRFSEESQPVLQKLLDYIDLRFQDADYQYEINSLLKDLYNQMCKYEKQVSATVKSGRIRFTELNLDNILIDQFQLKPKLHFEPLVTNAVGLKQKPCSVECRIAIDPTPKGFDFFKAPIQLDRRWQIKNRDPLYGCFEVYSKERQYLEVWQRNQIEEQRIEMNKFNQQIVVWRFLLCAYYINFKTEFGRKNGALSYDEAQQHFLESISYKKKSLTQNVEQISTFFNLEDRKIDEQEQFTFKFEQIGKFLSLEKQDSMIKNHHITKMQKYISLRWTMVRETQSYLGYMKGIFLNNMINAKKYLLLFFILCHQLLDESKRFVKFEKQRVGERLLMRKMVDKFIKKLSKSSPFEMFQTFYQKLIQYSQRGRDDVNFKYITQLDGYLLNEASKYKIIIDKVKNWVHMLNQMEDQGKKDYEVYEQALQNIQNVANTHQPQIRMAILEILEVEFVQRESKVQKIPNTNKQLQQKWIITTRKFATIVQAYLKLTEQNFISYDTMVLPLLEIDPLKGKTTIEAPKTIELAEEIKFNIEAVRQVLKIRPITGTMFYKVRS